MRDQLCPFYSAEKGGKRLFYSRTKFAHGVGSLGVEVLMELLLTG